MGMPMHVYTHYTQVFPGSVIIRVTIVAVDPSFRELALQKADEVAASWESAELQDSNILSEFPVATIARRAPLSDLSDLP